MRWLSAGAGDTEHIIGNDILTGTRYIGLSAALLGALMVGIIQYSAVTERLATYALKKSLGATSSSSGSCSSILRSSDSPEV